MKLSPVGLQQRQVRIGSKCDKFAFSGDAKLIIYLEAMRCDALIIFGNPEQKFNSN